MSVHIVRHAKAGDRSDWDGPDELRPLSRKGAGQADALAELLAGAPLKRILTSRYRRCVQTVEPLAERLGLDVETAPALAEEADVAATWALLEELAGTEAVVCTHGNLVGPLLDRLHRRGVELVTDRWTCKKASTWTVEVGPDGDFTRARYVPPPA
ncbi:MAG: histidine phosphatase family protein [Actinomycetota bacterium]|jgi:phosphohistidine phosphatase SixA|nr:histidine phosphatase family protein [Actinomycetota bacterium]